MLKHISIKKFRKFKNIDFDISSRLTLISGANGIGKSTLLGIIANGSGTKSFRTLINKDFHPEFRDYFILNKEEHVDGRTSDDFYEVILNYKYLETDIRKRVRTSHPNEDRLKLVPRTVNEEGKQNKEYSKKIEKSTGIKESARIPLPTYFVSMNRLFPFGESDSSLEDIIKVNNRKHISDNKLIIQEYIRMYNSVLPNSIDVDGESGLFETHKPKINYNSLYVMPSDSSILTQSIGQDSLSGIINAVLSFKNISLNNEQYKGGILCIDELEASLHPDAQKRLLKLLKAESEKLNLQIIFTSHSLTIIKEMLKLSHKDKERYSVLYFRNLSKPFLKDDDSYQAIKADLFSETHYANPKVKVYLEDAEAKFVLEQLIYLYENHYSSKNNILSKCEIVISEIGCTILLNLPKKDDYFKDAIIILDGDAKYHKGPNIYEYLETDPTGLCTIKKIPENVLFLPGDFSPEGEIYRILYNLCKNEEKHEPFWSFVETIDSANYYSFILFNTLEEMRINNKLTREPLKEWFISYQPFFEQSNIYKYHYFETIKGEIIKEFGENFNKLLSNQLKKLQSRRF